MSYAGLNQLAYSNRCLVLKCSNLFVFYCKSRLRHLDDKPLFHNKFLNSGMNIIDLIKDKIKPCPVFFKILETGLSSPLGATPPPFCINQILILDDVGKDNVFKTLESDNLLINVLDGISNMMNLYQTHSTSAMP